MKKAIIYIPTLLFCSLAAIFTVYVFFPGFLNVDAEWQFSQAFSGQYYDWHPPLLSYTWSLLNKIYYGQIPFLVLHNLLFWSALFLLALKLFPSSNLWRIVFIALFALLPSVYIQLGAIWKDTTMMVCLFLASVLLWYLQDTKDKRLQIPLICFIIILLFSGFVVRLNSFPAIIVLAYWLGTVIFRSHVGKSLIFSLLLLVGFYLTNKIINDKLLQPIPTYPYQQVMIHDLAAISVAKGELLFPDYISRAPQVSMKEVKRLYLSDSVGFLIFNKRVIPLSNNVDNLNALNTAWRQSIKNNFGIYLKHRLLCFAQLMIGCVAYMGEVCLVPYAINFHSTIFYRAFCYLRDSQPAHILFHGWTYLINCIFLIFASVFWRKKLVHHHEILYLALSGCLYVTGGFLYTPACEFRYLYWTVVSSLMALCIFARDVLRGQVETLDITD
jgi:hypothetical protein